MDHSENQSSIIKGKEIVISGSSSGGQRRSHGPRKFIQREHACDTSRNICQVGENVCIFRVPYPIRSCNKKAYAPSIVSLGPYGNGSTSTMDKYKCEVVCRTATRIKERYEKEKNWADILKKEFPDILMEEFQKSDKWEDFLMKVIQKSDKEIREQYEEEIKWDEPTLSRMMTHDACFILEFFKCAGEKGNQNDKGRSIFVFQNRDHKNSMHSAIFRDIMKLENQVPLFILKKILKLEFHDEITELDKILRNSNLFNGFPFHPSSSEQKDDAVKSTPEDDVNLEQKDDDVQSTPLADANLKKLKDYIKDDHGACHLLDLYRKVIKRLLKPKGPLTSSSQESNNASPDVYTQLRGSPDDTSFIPQAKSSKDKMHTPSAMNLKKAGIEFQSGDIKFKKGSFGSGKLFLPPITMKYRTETLLRNLVAYEECQRCSRNPKPTVISNYVLLLDSLIDSEKDVSVLRDSEVIKSFVGSDEVIVRMFNNLGIGITVENPDGDVALKISRSEPSKGSQKFLAYEEVMKEARDHYYSKWNVWIGQFREEHCSNPWYAISFLAGTALLVMTLIQTVYAVK